eukprot:2743514-Amphidinium_carterae.1
MEVRPTQNTSHMQHRSPYNVQWPPLVMLQSAKVTMSTKPKLTPKPIFKVREVNHLPLPPRVGFRFTHQHHAQHFQPPLEFRRQSMHRNASPSRGSRKDTLSIL